MRKAGARGFTLVEIMVVVVIIGILAVLVVPRVVRRSDDARIAAAKHDVATIQQSLKLYRLDNGRYPTSEQGLQALVAKPQSAPVPTNWRQYLDKPPKDPWGKEYQYLNPGVHGEVDVLARRRRRTGRQRRRRCRHRLLAALAVRGFTPIELLLVVMLIAIAAGVATLALGDAEPRRMREEAERLTALFRIATAEARASGRALTWEADHSGYRFRAYDDEATERLPEELRRVRSWPFEVERIATPRILIARAGARARADPDRRARARPPSRARRARPPEPGRLRGRAVRGFTLIEVLVALAIVAVALLAGIRAAGSMTQTNGELRLRALAQFSADNHIAELRAANAFPPVGTRTVERAGRSNLECVEEVKATPNPLFRRVEVRVYHGAVRSHMLAELIGILPRR